MFISVDQGLKWYGQPVQGESNFRSVNSYEDGVVTLAGTSGAYLSHDGGKTWTAVALPNYVSGVYNLTMAPGPVLWLGTHQGAMSSTDGGQKWHYIVNGLPKSDVLAVRYDAGGQRLLATALHTHGMFKARMAARPGNLRRRPEFPSARRLTSRDDLLGASAHNGLLLEQGAVTSSESARAAGGSSSSNQQ